MDYANTANELSRRILVLIRDHPEIMTLESAWDLFNVPGFRCDDLSPSFAQASWALTAARLRYLDGERP
jgi:hypothetical protein